MGLPPDEQCFFPLTVQGDQLNRRAGFIFRPQRLVRIIKGTDEMIRRIENGPGRTIILIEDDERRVFKIALKAREDVVDVTATPGIDRLHGRANRADVAMRPGEVTHELVLSRGGILQLVHADIAKQVLVERQRFGFLLQ